jgi:hypothetical protein
VLYMPVETDLYFPIGDARYEAAHPARDVRADSVAVGPPSRSGCHPRRSRVP